MYQHIAFIVQQILRVRQKLYWTDVHLLSKAVKSNWNTPEVIRLCIPLNYKDTTRKPLKQFSKILFDDIYSIVYIDSY